MFGIIAYIAVTGGVAAVLSFLYVVTRPIHVRDELRSWYVFAVLFVLAMALPYGAFEFMSRKWGADMKSAVQYALTDAGIKGDLKHYKVIFMNRNKATVMAVAEEQASWGGTDRPVVRIKLVRQNDKWVAETYSVLYSDNLNKDQLVFPPIW